MDACNSLPSSNSLHTVVDEELEPANILPSSIEPPLSLRSLSLLGHALP
jgi:hypothetical protein